MLLYWAKKTVQRVAHLLRPLDKMNKTQWTLTVTCHSRTPQKKSTRFCKKNDWITMTNTPMTFEEWFEQWRASTWKPLPSDARQDLPRHWAMNAQNHMSIAWQASQAQQEYSPEYTLQKIDECNELNIQVAQQASVIAELVEALEKAAKLMDAIGAKLQCNVDSLDYVQGVGAMVSEAEKAIRNLINQPRKRNNHEQTV